jgi:uncharacterized protein (DUF1684 family)
MNAGNRGTNEQTRRLRCWHCAREEAAIAKEVRRYTVLGFPLCCGARMILRKPEAAPPLPHFPDRMGRRWSPKPGIRVRISRSNGEPIAEVEAGLLNISVDGASIRLTVDAEAGKRIRFEFRPNRDRAPSRWSARCVGADRMAAECSLLVCDLSGHSPLKSCPSWPSNVVSNLSCKSPIANFLAGLRCHNCCLLCSSQAGPPGERCFGRGA